MRAGTIHFFLFVLLFLSCTISGSTGPAALCRCLSVWPGQLDRTDHARLSALCLCAFRCASNILSLPLNVCVPHASPIPQHANWASEGGGALSTKVSLSTAINKDFFFFVAFPAMWQLCTCYLKLLKDCADVPLNKRPCTHQRVTKHVET